MDELEMETICRGISRQIGTMMMHKCSIDELGDLYSSGRSAGWHLDESEMENICRGISRQVGTSTLGLCKMLNQ